METRLRLAKIYSNITSDLYRDDKLMIMFSYLNQYSPMVNIQLKRIEEEIIRLRKLSPEQKILSMEKIFADVRFFYELIYWIGLSVEKAAHANHLKTPNSNFYDLYKNRLKPVVENLKKNRILLNHIHFDELINYEVSGEGRFKKNLPKNNMLFQMEVLEDKLGILISDTELIPAKDVIYVDSLLNAMEPKWKEVTQSQ